MGRFVIAIALLLGFLVSVSAASAQDAGRTPSQPAREQERSALTDAAVVAAIIAASVAAYKAMGKPCACPSDTMRNGRACGGNSAYARGGGFRPLCFPSDVTADMITSYRSGRMIPGLR
jgi:hypothetical protein